jgi:hypothetical protein
VFAQRKDKLMADLTKTKKKIKPVRESWGKVQPPDPKGNMSSMLK